ncbi:hypothetical protein [uncultured Ruegeria sp.]|nr:hypothetical protein [uncultured Ruegeria sp.]
MAGGYYAAIQLGPCKRPCKGTVIATGTAEEVERYWIPGEVCIGWYPNYEPIRRLSQEGLASARKKRLRRKLEKKFPLFADQFEEAEHRARPQFFDGVRD